jgi:hypothetical protein
MNLKSFSDFLKESKQKSSPDIVKAGELAMSIYGRIDAISDTTGDSQLKISDDGFTIEGILVATYLLDSGYYRRFIEKNIANEVKMLNKRYEEVLADAGELDSEEERELIEDQFGDDYINFDIKFKLLDDGVGILSCNTIEHKIENLGSPIDLKVFDKEFKNFLKKIVK